MQEEHTGGVSEEIAEKHRTTAEGAITEDEYGHLVDGEWSESESGETMTATDATTGEGLARFQHGTPDDVDRAMASARDLRGVRPDEIGDDELRRPAAVG